MTDNELSAKQIEHFATADFAHYGHERAVRVPGQKEVEPRRRRWLILGPDGRELGVDAYELWARGYTPVWLASDHNNHGHH